MPPRAAAEVAVATSVPLAAVDLLVEAAPQALRVSAATTARPPVRTAVLGRNTVTGVSPEGVHRGSHKVENLSEQVGPSRPVSGVRLVNFGETVTSDSPDNSGARGSLAHLVYSCHAVHSDQVGESGDVSPGTRVQGAGGRGACRRDTRRSPRSSGGRSTARTTPSAGCFPRRPNSRLSTAS